MFLRDGFICSYCTTKRSQQELARDFRSEHRSSAAGLYVTRARTLTSSPSPNLRTFSEALLPPIPIPQRRPDQPQSTQDEREGPEVHDPLQADVEVLLEQGDRADQDEDDPRQRAAL